MKKNSQPSILVTAVLLASLAFVAQRGAFAASPDTKPSSAEVTIDNFSFTPPAITVKAGTQITWKNRDDIPHTVVSDDHLFKSKALDTDDTFSFTPTKAGTYTYFCSLHPKMTAKVVVE
jgi:plastocyanin